MVKKDFDNLDKLIRVLNTMTSGSVISTEIDLELPRGYVAKPWRIDTRVIGTENVDAGNADQVIHAALLRDPDDITTVLAPLNSVQHDVVHDWKWEFTLDATDDVAFQSEITQTFILPEHIDVISARNMRFNSLQENADPDFTAECLMHYTLEKVSDADFLALLDIL